MVARREDLLGRRSSTGSSPTAATAIAIDCDLSDLDAVDALAADVEKEIGGVDILVNNAGRSIRRPLAESLDRWHDVERTMSAELLLAAAADPRAGARRCSSAATATSSTSRPGACCSEASPLFAVYNASKAALSAVSRVIETEWAHHGVHSTTLYYPLVATPMIAPTKAYDGLPALTPDEAATGWSTAARHRPVRIAPRMAVTARALDIVAPGCGQRAS